MAWFESRSRRLAGRASVTGTVTVTIADGAETATPGELSFRHVADHPAATARVAAAALLVTPCACRGRRLRRRRPTRRSISSSPAAASWTAPARRGSSPTSASAATASRAIGDLRGVAATAASTPPAWSWRPGFIDPHVHARERIFELPTAEGYLLQGLTTVVDGNDGSSPLPLAPWFEKVQATTVSPNVALFVGQGTVREAVMGTANRKATRG